MSFPVAVPTQNPVARRVALSPKPSQKTTPRPALRTPAAANVVDSQLFFTAIAAALTFPTVASNDIFSDLSLLFPPSPLRFPIHGSLLTGGAVIK